MFTFRGLDENTKTRGNAGIFAGQIRTDDLPIVAAVLCREQNIRAKIERVRVHVRKDQRSRPIETEFSSAQHNRRDLLCLPGDSVKASDLSTVNHVWIERVGRDVSVLFHANGIPVAESNRSKIAAARCSYAATLLLTSINPVRELIVGDYVVKLRGRLVVPTAPGRTVVHADSRSLIGRQCDDLWILRIDPDRVIVVPARCAFKCREILSGVR